MDARFSKNIGTALGASADNAAAAGAGAINGVAGIANAVISGVSALTQQDAQTEPGLHAQQEAAHDNKVNSTASGIATTVISVLAAILCLI